ncbi:MAG: hypothetical protein JWP63_1847 [Candidatus Solibacter sp.]|jgi:hypothetical protein|nr:hypothetical protein [Candidatus Solibacter sp.]
MKKLILLVLMMAGACAAADVRFMWLLTLNSVPGLPQVSMVPQYGVQVFMDSDNPAVTEFQITTVVQIASGDIVVNTQTVARDGKAPDVQYSTVYVSWIGPDPNFQVLSIQVKAVVGSKGVSKPFPGRNYDSGSAGV